MDLLNVTPAPDPRKDPPFQHETNRTLWIGWGANGVSLALQIIVGGLFFGYLFLFGSIAMVMRGWKPAWFSVHHVERRIVGTPYRRTESVRSWSIAVLVSLALAASSTWVHRRIAPESPDLAKTIIDGVKNIIEQRKVVIPTPSPAPMPAEDPVVHLEPERDILWSTHPGQQLGIFTVQFHNTGVPVDVTEVELKYFLAQKTTGVIIKRLPNVTDPHKGSLKQNASFPISIDFNPYMDDISEVSANFREGPSLPGVYTVVTYRRHSDGKDFEISKAYGLLVVPYGADKKPKGVALFAAGTNMDGPEPEPIRNRLLTLSEVLPYLALPERWISITKEISVGSDGKMHIRQY